MEKDCALLTMAKDVMALIDHLNLDQFDLVGYSMGSCMAIQTALRQPRVSTLVLGGTGTGETETWDSESRAMEVASLREPAES